MIRRIVVLRDVKAEMFLQPFFVPTVGVAYRTLMDELKRGGEGNAMAAHPHDFELYEIGGFDDDIGLLLPMDKGKFLCSLDSLLEEK